MSVPGNRPTNRFFALHRILSSAILNANISMSLAASDYQKMVEDKAAGRPISVGFPANLAAFERRLVNIHRAIKALRVQMLDENYAEDHEVIHSPALDESVKRMIAHSCATESHLRLILSYHRQGSFALVLDEFDKRLDTVENIVQEIWEKGNLEMGARIELVRAGKAWIDFLLLSMASGMLLAEVNYMAAGHGSLITETA